MKQKKSSLMNFNSLFRLGFNKSGKKRVFWKRLRILLLVDEMIYYYVNKCWKQILDAFFLLRNKNKEKFRMIIRGMKRKLIIIIN